MHIWIRYPSSHRIVFSVYKWIVHQYGDAVDCFFIEYVEDDYLSRVMTGSNIRLVPYDEHVHPLLLKILAKNDLIIVNPDFPDSIYPLFMKKLDCIVTTHHEEGMKILKSKYLRWTGSCFFHTMCIRYCDEWTHLIDIVAHHRTIHVIPYDGVIVKNEESARFMDMRYWSDVHHDLMKLNFFLWNRLIENNSLSSDSRIAQDVHHSEQMSKNYIQNPSVCTTTRANCHEDPYTA